MVCMEEVLMDLEVTLVTTKVFKLVKSQSIILKRPKDYFLSKEFSHLKFQLLNFENLIYQSINS